MLVCLHKTNVTEAPSDPRRIWREGKWRSRRMLLALEGERMPQKIGRESKWETQKTLRALWSSNIKRNQDSNDGLHCFYVVSTKCYGGAFGSSNISKNQDSKNNVHVLHVLHKHVTGAASDRQSFSGIKIPMRVLNYYKNTCYGGAIRSSNIFRNQGSNAGSEVVQKVVVWCRKIRFGIGFGLWSAWKVSL